MLRLEDVDIRYAGVLALSGATLAVGPGEIVALLGANGAGKTTTLRAISGLARPAAGRIVWEGKRIDGLAPEEIVRRGVAHVPEGRQVFPELTVEENLLIGSYARRDRGQVKRELAAILERFPGLAARRRQPGANLSGGEQQVLAIARAMLAAPRLLLLDEPSMGLAPRVVREVFGLVRALNQAGVAVLLVEQNARMALGVAHRAYVLDTGRIALSGTAAELRHHPALRHIYLGHGQAVA